MENKIIFLNQEIASFESSRFFHSLSAIENFFGKIDTAIQQLNGQQLLDLFSLVNQLGNRAWYSRCLILEELEKRAKKKLGKETLTKKEMEEYVAKPLDIARTTAYSDLQTCALVQKSGLEPRLDRSFYEIAKKAHNFKKAVEYAEQQHDAMNGHFTLRQFQSWIIEQKRKNLITETPPLPDGKYRTIVIDPPWDVEKILRDVRPNQDVFEYATMNVEQISQLPIPTLAYEDGCHVYLWTTHHYLPDAFKIFEAWGVKYQCLMTWVKNVGFTPFSWMYSTEHVLFGRIGSLPLLKNGIRLDFQADVREHSRKPDIFYNIVQQASPEPRIDMFSREKRDGFNQYGNEPEKF